MKKYILLSILVLSTAGCQKLYYGTMEKLGVHKREILVDRVEDARDSQQQTKEQFASALEKFRSVVDVNAGQLEEKYDQLKSELDKSESKAAAVSKRIKDVEDVAQALFDEWEQELEQYNNVKLKNESKKKLTQTRNRYEMLINTMKRAESKIEPVLSAFRDQVLFLKHNLNAQAIASLKTEFGSIEYDINGLVMEMERSIAEADEFLRTMKE